MRMMFATVSSFLLLFGCAAAPVPMAGQPELATLANAYAGQLRAVGITRLTSRGSGAMVRVETSYGFVYIPYPEGAPSAAFVLEIDPHALSAASPSFDRARDTAALAAIVPAAIRTTTTNNTFQWNRANPWN